MVAEASSVTSTSRSSRWPASPPTGADPSPRWVATTLDDLRPGDPRVNPGSPPSWRDARLYYGRAAPHRTPIRSSRRPTIGDLPALPPEKYRVVHHERITAPSDRRRGPRLIAARPGLPDPRSTAGAAGHAAAAAVRVATSPTRARGWRRGVPALTPTEVSKTACCSCCSVRCVASATGSPSARTACGPQRYRGLRHRSCRGDQTTGYAGRLLHDGMTSDYGTDSPHRARSERIGGSGFHCNAYWRVLSPRRQGAADLGTADGSQSTHEQTHAVITEQGVPHCAACRGAGQNIDARTRPPAAELLDGRLHDLQATRTCSTRHVVARKVLRDGSMRRAEARRDGRSPQARSELGCLLCRRWFVLSRGKPWVRAD